MSEQPRCELCELAVPQTTRHHLIPRTLHSNKWFKKHHTREELAATIDLCRSCHREIHRLIRHKEMGKHYNTLSALKAHEKVSRFVMWRRRKVREE